MTKTRKLEILIATRNGGKIREIQSTLSSLPLKLRLLEEFADISPVDEVGQTYAENASLKAIGYASQTGLWALADDSGLEVAALGGRPGLFSARFGGDHLSDRERTDKLLATLCNNSDRTARFVCSMALAGCWPNEKPDERSEPRLLKLTEGICEGAIALVARGKNGFGFDPMFIPTGYSETFAELPDGIKSKISHRALALAAMHTFLDRLSVQT
ncbi:MAG TPA: non-canonical purine NTP pyrophosphatase [Pyrinomonadaceae bacterium]|jgi:XTP/dITP diphosphohydrolase|nr:non-canonical purine NTP pyrophosphatase [Pyrinomonadaceae bacterium]